MPNISIIAKNETVEIDRDLLQKFSGLAAKTKNTEFKLDVDSRYIGYIKEYAEHHNKKESPAPAGQVQLTWVVSTVFEDKWDSAFFKRVIEADAADPFLREFARTVNYFDITVLFRKIVVVLAIGIVSRAGSTKGDKLAEEFSKLAMKAKA